MKTYELLSPDEKDVLFAKILRIHPSLPANQVEYFLQSHIEDYQDYTSDWHDYRDKYAKDNNLDLDDGSDEDRANRMADAFIISNVINDLLNDKYTTFPHSHPIL